MDETFCDFRRQRACSVYFLGFAGASNGRYQSCGRGRQRDFTTRMDFSKRISADCRADKCIFDVCDRLHFPVAIFDVAALSQENFY